jgi:diguanylate cyclase (GGDEF)-like protein
MGAVQMGPEHDIPPHVWKHYLRHTRQTVTVRCAGDGTIRACNASAGRVFEADQKLEGRSLEEFLHRADRPKLDLHDLPSSGDCVQLVLATKRSEKVLHGYFFTEGEDILLVADVVGKEDDVTRQLAVLANEISDISRNLQQRNRELREANRRITQLSRTDPLTGLPNRRYFLERMEPAIAMARRHAFPLSLIMADLDHFKHVNDTFGHERGDCVLRSFACLLHAECRKEDLPCRFGGEEFVILLPHTDASHGASLAERIRTRFADQTTTLNGELCTASFGVAPIQPDDTPGTLIARADEALYAAKAAGRNRTVAV